MKCYIAYKRDVGRGEKTVPRSQAITGYCKKKEIGVFPCLCRINQETRSLILIRLRPEETLKIKKEQLETTITEGL